jgi:hypothetical protein
MGWRLPPFRRRPESLLKVRRPSRSCPAGEPVVILTTPPGCSENSLMYDFFRHLPVREIALPPSVNTSGATWPCSRFCHFPADSPRLPASPCAIDHLRKWLQNACHQE